VFLTVLARYLKLKAEAGQMDQMYAYARASLLHYAQWMVQHEETYFTHPEKLEFPTETWAAQDFRKANVLRLACCFCQEGLRAGLFAKGQDLMDQALCDLRRFPQPATTRLVAITLVEAMKDAYFSHREVNVLPTGPSLKDVAVPQMFLSQRTRVMRQVKSPKAMIGSLGRLANPVRWLRFRFQH
jgi:hypothetical protein